MPKKKKKPQYKPSPVATRELPPWASKLKPPENLSPEERAKAIERLKTLFTGLSAPAEGVLEMLDRLEIPWERVQNVPDDKKYDTIVFLVLDMEKGEKRNDNLLKRIYKDNTEIVPPEPETELMQ